MKTQPKGTRPQPPIRDLEREIDVLEVELLAERQKRQQAEESLARQQQELEVERQQRRVMERELRAQQGRAAKLLSFYRPLDYLRLLWWILVMPDELKAYRATLTDREYSMLQRQTSWLISSLIWWPVFLWIAVPLVTDGLEMTPSAAITLLTGILFAWLAIGFLGIFDNGVVAFGAVMITAIMMLITIAVTTGISDVEAKSFEVLLWGGVLAMISTLIALTVATISHLEVAEIVAGVVAVVVAGGIVLTLFNSSSNLVDVVLIVGAAAVLAGVAQERYKETH